MGVSQNNLKSCSECGRRINKGDYCWCIRERTNHDGSQHLCESCALLLSRADELDILSSRLSTGVTPKRSSCTYCEGPLPAGTRVGMVRIRRKDGNGVTKTTRLCMSCVQSIDNEIRAYRHGMHIEDAPQHLSSPSPYLREVAAKTLGGMT